MSKWLAQTELIQNIARNLLQSRQQHYSQEGIKFKIMDHPQLSQRHLRTKNKYNQTLYGILIDKRQHQSQYCIIFMHGLASNVLQGASLIDHLLPNTALFCFDFSGSGKSTGLFNTYGLKECEDIKFVISMLEQKGYKHFILWGRSMGAVACLLSTFCEQRDDQIILQVADSPFCTFQSICEIYAKKYMKIPEILISSAISILKESFATHPFNPFQINLLKIAKNCKIPTLFVYNQHDDVIPCSNTESIIKQLNQICYYQRIIIEDTHNSIRGVPSLALIFQKIRKQIRIFENGSSKVKKKALDVCSSFVKKKSNLLLSFQNLATTQKEEQTGKKEHRRSAIYCSLSKKSSTLFSPKGSKKINNNPQRFFFENHF